MLGLIFRYGICGANDISDLDTVFAVRILGLIFRYSICSPNDISILDTVFAEQMAYLI